MLNGNGRSIKLIYGGFFTSVLIAAIACGSSGGGETPAAGASPSAAATIGTTAPAATGTATPGAKGPGVSGPTATASPVSTSVSSTVTRPTPTVTVFVPPATPTPAFGRELLEFGGFERAIFDHWEPRLIAGQLIETVTDKKVSGERSLHMTTSPDEEEWPWVILRERFPTEAGSDYRLQFNAIQTEQGPVQVFLDFHNGAGEFIQRKLFSDWMGTEGEWVQIEGVVEAPEGAATALVMVQLRILLKDELPRPDLLEVWVDDVSVRKAVE